MRIRFPLQPPLRGCVCHYKLATNSFEARTVHLGSELKRGGKLLSFPISLPSRSFQRLHVCGAMKHRICSGHNSSSGRNTLNRWYWAKCFTLIPDPTGPTSGPGTLRRLKRSPFLRVITASVPFSNWMIDPAGASLRTRSFSALCSFGTGSTPQPVPQTAMSPKMISPMTQ